MTTPTHSKSVSSLKILLGLMLAEEKNCYRILGILCLMLLLLFGFWWLPGFGVLWRCLGFLQTITQYKMGFLGNSNNDGNMGIRVNPDSLDRVFENLKEAWQRAIRS